MALKDMWSQSPQDISIESLLRLKLKEEFEDPAIVQRIHNILIPREFTKLDEIIELLFSAATDLRPEVSEADHVSQPGDVEAAEEDETSAATFSDASLKRIEQQLGVSLQRQTRSSVSSANGDAVVICKASRTYADRASHAYWFGFYEFQMDMITAASAGFAALQCGGPNNLLLVPAKTFCHGPI